MQERELKRRALAVAKDELLMPLPPNAAAAAALRIQRQTEAAKRVMGMCSETQRSW